MHFFGIDWVGINAENGRKLLLSVIFVGVVLLSSLILRALVGLLLGRTDHATVQTKFWTRQGVSLLAAFVLIIGLLSIWFNDPTRLATAFGLMSAGLAFALQQVVTAIAGYFVILRGSTFTVGDRISMGGVRGDVLRLGFIQTTIMEMGQPPSVQAADPAMWVRSRQFTGRIVTVSNSKIFAEPVFNYTRDFAFIWEEMAIPITYQADRSRVEAILLEAAKFHAVDPNSLASEAKDDLQERFGMERGSSFGAPRRRCLTAARRTLAARRRSFAAALGRVGRRGAGGSAARRINAASRSSASCRLRSCVR